MNANKGSTGLEKSFHGRVLILVVAMVGGVALALALLWTLSGEVTPVAAAPVPDKAPSPAQASAEKPYYRPLQDSGWTRMKPITIHNASASELTDYQVRLVVPYDSGMQNDFADLRFWDGDGNSLGYWVQTYTLGVTATAWVKIPSIPVPQTTIYMYYGNSSASSASDGDAVFEFFDDFGGASLDTDKWTRNDGTYSVSNSEFTGAGPSNWVEWIRTESYEVSGKKIVEFRLKPTDSYEDWDTGISIGEWKFTDETYDNCGNCMAIDRDKVWGDYSETSQSRGDNEYHNYRVVLDGSDAYFYDDTISRSNTITYAGPHDPEGHVYLFSDADGVGRDAKYDWIFVRAYASAAPTASFGSETQIADLVVAKSVTPKAMLERGDSITYTLNFSNVSDIAATGVVITDHLPADVTNLQVTSNVAITDTGAASPYYVWQVQDLDPDQGGAITVSGQISSTMPEGQTFTNLVTVTAAGGEYPGGSSDAASASTQQRPGLDRMRAITIYNSGASELTDYQVRLVIPYAEGMQEDFDDLRFGDGDGNCLSYWIQAYEAASSAAVWVKVPSIPTPATRIYMYYGNPDAPKGSDGEATFIYFDDFSWDTWDQEGQFWRDDDWIRFEQDAANSNPVGDSPYAGVRSGMGSTTDGSETGGFYYQVESAANTPCAGDEGGIQSNVTIDVENAIVNWRGGNRTGDGDGDPAWGFGDLDACSGGNDNWIDDGQFTHGVGEDNASHNGQNRVRVNGVLGDQTGDTLQPEWTIVTETIVSAGSNVNISGTFEGAGVATLLNRPNPNYSGKIQFAHDDNGSGLWVDWVLVRKYASSVPTAALGSLTQVPDLSVAKSVEPVMVASHGGPITYTITFSNTNSNVASGVVITDRLPNGVTDVEVISSGVAITDTGAAPPDYVWRVQDLEYGQGGAITISGRLSSTLPEGYTFVNAVAGAVEHGDCPCDNSDAVTASIQQLPGLEKARPITIHNSGAELTDYPVRMVIDYDTEMEEHFNDLRFGDGDGKCLSYWIEDYTVATTATVWVKMPSIPASSEATIYVYYGNSSALPASDGEAVFDFFDDFEGTSLDADRWTDVEGSYTVEGSTFHGAGGDEVEWARTTVYQTPPSVTVQFKMKPDSDGDWDSGIGVGTDGGGTVAGFTDDIGGNGLAINDNIWWTDYNYIGGRIAGDDYHVYKVVMTDTKSMYDLTDGRSNSRSGADSGYIWLINDSESNNRGTSYDWIFARQFVPQEPTASVGSETYAADLVIVKSVTPTTPNAGGPITYTIAFSNAGHALAPAVTDVVITDSVPVSVTVIDVISSGVAITDAGAAPPNYAWRVQDLAQTQGGVITISGRLSGTLPEGHVFANPIIAAGVGGCTCNDSDAVTVSVNHHPTAAARSNLYHISLDDDVGLLSGVDSTDVEDGDNLRYGWTASDTALVFDAPSAPTTTFTTPSSPAVVAITLTVTDTAGLTDTASLVITAANVAVKELVVSNDSPIKPRQRVNLAAEVARGSSVTYTWSFGDGDKEALGLGQWAANSHQYTPTYVPMPITYTVLVTASNRPTSTTWVVTATTVVTLTGYIDLSSWMMTGPPASGYGSNNEGDWRCPPPAAGLHTGDPYWVYQSRNPYYPSFYVSPASVPFSTTIKGMLRAGSDDDFIGFVFGYQKPRDKELDFDFAMVDWLEDTHGAGGNNRAGARLVKVQRDFTGDPDSNGDGNVDALDTGDRDSPFWKVSPLPDTSGFTVVTSDTANLNQGKGWKPYPPSPMVTYTFEFSYTQTSARVIITDTSSGETKVEMVCSASSNLDCTFEEGRFGFYNYSQAWAEYGNVEAAGSIAIEARDDAYTTTEHLKLEVGKSEGVLINDLSPLVLPDAKLQQDVSTGTLDLDSDGSFVYTPTAAGHYTFVYDAEAPDGATSAATVTLYVNARPVLDLNGAGAGVAYTATFTEDAGAVHVTDDPDVTDANDTHLVSATASISNPLDGALETLTATTNSTITVSYDSGTGVLSLSGRDTIANYEQVLSATTYHNGSDTPDSTDRTIIFVVNDGVGDSAPVTTTVKVIPVNDPPEAVDDTGHTEEDDDVDVDVLANDSDPEGNDLSVTGVGDPITGTTGSADNPIEYDPSGGFEHLAVGEFGRDTFTYTIDDGNGGAATATVTVIITGVNDPPTATNDSGVDYTTDENTTFTTGNVLDNDDDPDASDKLSVIDFDDTDTEGSVTNNGDGTFYYDPNGRFEHLADGEFGRDTFTYTIDDGNGGTATATVTVIITGVNDPPTANDDRTATPVNTPVAIDVLHHNNPGPPDTDPEDGTAGLTVVTVTQPLTGTVVISGAGPNNEVLYSPNHPTYTGTVVFAYTISDTGDLTATAIVSVEVGGVNDRPEAKDDHYSIAEDELLKIAPPGVLSNDHDEDGPDKKVDSYIDPGHGTLVLTTTYGSFSYDPNTDYCGEDSFTYTATDTISKSNAATVTISITCVNDAPSFHEGADVTVDEDSGSYEAAWASNMSSGPSNESSQALTFTVSNDNHGLFSAQPAIDEAGNLTFTLDDDTFGAASVTVELKDSGGTANGGQDTSASKTFTITVEPINDAPSFTPGPDQAVGKRAGPQTIAGWATDISPGPNEAGQVLTFTVSNDNSALFSAQPAIDETSGDLTFEPDPTQIGTARVTVILQDSGGTGNGGQDSVTQYFDIEIEENTAPFAQDDEAVSDVGVQVNIYVLDNDSDPDPGDTLSILAIGPLEQGHAEIVDGGAEGDDYINYTLDENRHTAFTYTVSDGSKNSVAEVRVYVSNSPPAARDDETCTHRAERRTIDVLANDTDPEGGPLEVIAVSAPYTGTTDHTSDNVTYTPPDATFTGTVAFTYTVIDDGGPLDNFLTDTAAITVHVQQNRWPTAIGDVAHTTIDASRVIHVLENDSDPDMPCHTDHLTVFTASQPLTGSVTWDDTTVTYIPPSGYTGTVPFTATFPYTITDNALDTTGPLTASAWVTVTVVYPVGGHTAPVDTAALLWPWIVLFAVLGTAGIVTVTVLRRRITEISAP